MIFIARDAARGVFNEVQRWVDEGLRAEGTALESIVYPLSALVPTRGLRCPLELLDLDGIQHIVISGVAVPPDGVKAFSPSNCHFDAGGGDMAHANASFNDRIDAQLQLHPRLGVHSKLHSHPFSADPFLSSGDMHHGVNSAKARRWRERRGLGTALLHVVYPDGEPAPDERPWRLGAEGAVSGGRDGQPKVYWRVRTWGSLPGGEMRDLGDARVVPQRNPLVRSARKPPYWTTRRGRRWCDAQKAALRQAGYPLVSRNMLGRGWRRYIVGDGRRAILLALPPDLPRMAPRVLEIIDAAADNFQLLPLPRHMAEARTLKMTSLSAIAAYYLGLNHATG